MTQPVIEEEAMPQGEITRLGALFSWQSILFVVLCVAGLALGINYIFGLQATGGLMLEAQYYWIFIGLFGAASFVALPAFKGQKNVPWYDLVAGGAIMVISFWFSTHAWDMVQSGWVSVPFGILIYLLMLELARRSGGIPFLVVVIVLGLYPLIADRLPGIMMGIPYSFDRMIEYHVFNTEGLMGVTTKVVAEIILGFLVFAGVLLATGAGDFFIDLANAGFGKYRGGPAKVSIVASGFFGSLSGSIFSNIAGTGSITIPTMKKVGYPPHYAAAIEACASTGGVVMPPVMGAIAFVMAITIGVDYATVMIAAILPSFLYYFGLMLQVDAYAAKTGMQGMSADQLPKGRDVMKRGWPYLLVMIFLTWGLLYMRWEYYAPWYACVLMFVLSFLRKDTMMTPLRIFETIRAIGVLIAQSAAIILPIAFVVSGLTITGVTGSMTSSLVQAGGDNVYLIIALGVLACFVMGMAGLAIVAYIFLAVTLAPAIIEIGGLNEIAVHFFIIYYAMLSVITPPVGAAAFLAATIAGAKPMQSSFTAMRLGVVIYFVPLFFLFEPSLVLQGDLTPLIYVLPSVIIGITILAGGLEGYLLGFGRVRTILRLPLAMAGFAFSYPGIWGTVVGGIACVVLVGLVWLDNRDSRDKAAIQSAP
ncbi:TRAP transporter fused permease subunit [Pseudooceanicola sp.]|uniref:TRAP transporter permease n=1 Tax=Pseudooceanicola sp. TaxID=1914328 RepID=UPI002638FA1B|nr:TRAP transporter fused permease subunit [Pseudooceanicola sp.]MDF1854418.1 TRAP transporter fused permease subunit [Pseudooceanicola sp.]